MQQDVGNKQPAATAGMNTSFPVSAAKSAQLPAHHNQHTALTYGADLNAAQQLQLTRRLLRAAAVCDAPLEKHQVGVVAACN